MRGLLLLFILFALYPALHALYTGGHLPQPLQAPVRTILAVLDGDINEVSIPAGRTRDAAADITEGRLEELPADISGYLIIDCLDVGQASCTLIRQGDSAMLYDCGAEVPSKIRKYLEDEGIKKLKMVVLSHSDADHINAFPAIAYDQSIDQVLTSPWMQERGTGAYSQLKDTLSWYRIKTTAAAQGDTIPLGDAAITILGPTQYDPETENNNSLIIKITYGNTSAILCGDAQAEEENSIISTGADLKTDILSAGHHGSNTSSTKPFLKAAAPTYAAISCGKNNDYNHPGNAALKRLKKSGATVLRTDQNGSIRFITDGSHISVSTEK